MIVAQATTDTVQYRSPYAALQKVVEGETVTLLTKTNAAVEQVSDELLFENATLAYEADSAYAGSSIYAETADVYVDLTQTGEVNLRSGTVTVTPANAQYVLTLGGTGLNADGSAIEGGYSITAPNAYTLDADDAATPIPPERGGGASVTLANIGETVTVDYGTGAPVTYTATEANQKFYLGQYIVENKVSGDAKLTTTASPYHGETFTLTYVPTTGYELNGGVFRVAMRTPNGAQSTVPINFTKDESQAAQGKIIYTGEQTGYTDADCGSIGAVTVTAYYTDEVCTKVEVTVEDVRSHLIVYTEGNPTDKVAPSVILIGEGIDKNGDTVELYRFNTNMSYYDGVTEKLVKSIDWSRYALTGVRHALANADGSEGAYADGTLVDANKAVNADAAQNIYYLVDLTQGNQYVKFTYRWNWVEVKVKAVLADGVTEIAGASRVDDMEAGKEQSVIAPSVPGYEPDMASKTITPSATGVNEVVFTYTQILSKVNVVAQDENGHTLTTVAGATIARGETVPTDDAQAPALPGYTLVAGSGVASSATYDGTQDVTVTYTYRATEKNLVVKAYLYDANKDEATWDILKEDKTSYAGLTPGQTLNVNAPIPGYQVKVEAGDDRFKEVKSVYLTNDADTQEVHFYYEVDPDYNSNITIRLVDADGAELGGYRIPGVAGVAQIVTAPTLHGYTVDRASVTAYTDKVNETSATAGEVVFTYTRNIWTVTVKLADSSQTPAADITDKAPLNYPTSIEVVRGEGVSITAPSIYGYSLAEGQSAVVRLDAVAQDETVTINYVPVEKAMVTIVVRDMLDDGAGSQTEFMTRTEQVAAGTAEKTISMLSIPGYKLTAAAPGTLNAGTLTVDTSAANPGDTITVMVSHTYNRVTVTVNAVFGGRTLGSYQLPLDKGVESQVFPPVVEGYTAMETSKSFTPGDTDTTVEFTLTQNTGNVTIVVVDKDGGAELARRDGGTVARGDAIELTAIAANLPAIEFYRQTAAAPAITVGTAAVNASDLYDGSGDITVTWQYERKTQSLKVVKKDFDTKQVLVEETIADLPVGREHALTGVTPPADYRAVDGNPASCYVKDAENQEVVFWYQSEKADDYATITVKLVEDGTDKLIQSYPVSNLRKGVQTTITAPVPAGYQLVGDASRTVMPGTDTEVVFRYTIANPKTLTIKLVDNTDGSERHVPAGYTAFYTLKLGDELIITAPAVGGYALKGANLDGATQANYQVVTVSYDGLILNSTLTFSYTPVTQANFVTHVIQFNVGGNTLYSHEKMIAKGNGDQVIYSENDVTYSVPGYAFDHIEYRRGGSDIGADEVTNDRDATIIYYFTEDAATILIKQTQGGTTIGTEQLTDFRKGQQVKVVAPHVEGKVLVGDLIQTVSLTQTGETEVTFEYVDAGAVTLTLREVGGGVIRVLSPATATTYEAGTGELDLSANGWTYSAADTTGVFDVDGKLAITDLAAAANYDIYYIKQTRTVEFVAVDKAKLDGKTLEEAIAEGIDAYRIETVTPAGDTARVGESYKAVAQSFNGWNLKDQLSKVYDVPAGTEPLKVYFVYEAKASGTIHVHYHYGDTSGKELGTYTVNATVGDTVTISAPATLENGKYQVMDTTANPSSVNFTVSENSRTVDFLYEANFWTVDEKVALDGGAASEHGSREVVKDGGVGSGIRINPAEASGTVTITYVRADGSAVLPGGGGQIGDGDDIIVKPDGTGSVETVDTPTPGSAKVNDPDGGTVIRPDPAGSGEKESIKVPDGTVVKPDGGIVLPDGGGEIGPDSSIPDDLPENYAAIIYKANGGTGADVKRVVKAGEARAMRNPFTGYNNAPFTGWNTSENGVGGTAYQEGAPVAIPNGEKSLTLYAQWNSTSYTHSATITYEPNGAAGQAVADTVGSNSQTSFSVLLRSNPFTLDGWNFGGWSEQTSGGRLYRAGQDPYTLSKGDAKTLYAQWYKVHDDGSITVPGKDGNPNTANDNATANGSGTQNPSRDETTGDITIPAGGSITVTDPASGEKETILLPDGGILKPDGTIAINRRDKDGDGNGDGTITIPGTDGTTPDVTDKNGNEERKAVYTLTYTINNGETEPDVVVKAVDGDEAAAIDNPFSWTGYTFANWIRESDSTEVAAGTALTVNGDEVFHAQWMKINPDGSVELPGKDGDIKVPDDNVVVTPDKPNGKVTPQPDGSVKVEDNGGTVTRPNPGDPTKKEDVKVPDGTVVKPDGTIVLPDNGGTIRPDDTLPNGNLNGYVTITYKANGDTGEDIQQLVKANAQTSALAGDAFIAPADQMFVQWVNAADNSEAYAANAAITPTADMTLQAQWKSRTPDTPVYTVILTYRSGSDSRTQKVSSDQKTFTAQLESNTFSAPAAGWTFMGWTTDTDGGRNGAFYRDTDTIALNIGDTDPVLYAVWYEQKADGSITLPGRDLDPTTAADNVTVNPGTGTVPAVRNDSGEGYIEAGTGNTINQPAGSIEVVNGPVNVYPDGTIVIPGRDGSSGTEDDVKVKPDNSGNPAGTIDNATGDTTITNPDGAAVEIPGENPPATRGDIKVPEGTVIKPDGTIILPDGKDGEDENGGKIPGGSEVRPDGSILYAYTVKFEGVTLADEIVKIAGGVQRTITAPAVNGCNVDKTSVAVVGGDMVDGGFVITFRYTAANTGGSTAPTTRTFTITATAGANGAISPSGSVSVREGSDRVFTISGSNGYTVADVVVDGRSVGAVTSYVFSNVTGSHSISATFKPTKPASDVADPDETGVSEWLRVTDHISYMTGYDTGLFGPNDNLTRAQAAMIFYRLLLDQDVALTASFRDVPADAWYATAVDTLASLGIISGQGDGEFAPNRQITRAEFVTIATRFAKATDRISSSFTDVADGAWYAPYIMTAVSYGWVNGIGDRLFAPDAEITRAEAATIINRMLARSADREFVNAAGVQQFPDVSPSAWYYYQVMEAANAHDHRYDESGYEVWKDLRK